jgi:hypothetical protein
LFHRSSGLLTLIAARAAYDKSARSIMYPWRLAQSLEESV